MKIIVSTIGTAPYRRIYLVEIIQPFLKKSKHHVINSYTFVKEAKSWQISQVEVQVSFDVVHLYPSVPVHNSINVSTDTSNN